jgi:hypothetical protein
MSAPPVVTVSPYVNVYLADGLRELVDLEATRQGITRGRLVVRLILAALTGTDAGANPARRVVEVLQSAGSLKLAEVARLAGVEESYAGQVLGALQAVRMDGLPDGLVRLEDRGGMAVYSFAA